MDLPGKKLTRTRALSKRNVCRRPQAGIEMDEKEGRTDPGDRRDHMQPAQQHAAPFHEIGVKHHPAGLVLRAPAIDRAESGVELS
jgi:hypothetical protein